MVAAPAWQRWSEPESAPVLAIEPPPSTAPTLTLAQAPTPGPVTDHVAETPTVNPAPAAPPTPPVAAPPPIAAPPPAEQPPAGELPASQEQLQLSRLSAVELHQRIESALGRKFPPVADDGTPWLRFSVDSGDGVPMLVAANRETRRVSLVGRPDQLRAWRQIITALDAPAAADKVTHLLAAEKAAVPQIRQAVSALLAQAELGAADQAGAPPADEATTPVAENESGLLGPVQIEVVEGTDLFVIRGNPRDVERVMEVIREIEAMSRVSEPQVAVYTLNHVDSQPMATLLGQVFAPTTQTGVFSLTPYYGQLLALPLGRPNAVLLIGAPGTVGKAREILGQLDAPSAAPTQFEVFRLKNAPAEQTQLVVEQLFTAAAAEQTQPATFGPKALVIAEARTNSLIVRAGPSDMAEVRELIAEIDRPGGETVNEIRVFKLRSALATDLAPVLQRAVRGESPIQGRETPEGLAQLLQLVTIDAEGQKKLESGVLAGVVVNADVRANALVVSAPPDSMPLLAALISQLDQPPDAAAELKVFTIKNGDAVSLADMLRSLFGAANQGGNQGGGGPNQNANQQIFQLRVEVDERTNSIIAAGSADELLVVEAVLLRLDDSESRTRLNRVYKLKNASAADVAVALQEWLERKREIEETAPGVLSPFAQVEREVVVVAEPNSNSLIVSATPAYYEEIATIVQQLDEQAPMVLIQVLIGEVRLGDADEFGVELGLQDSVLFDRSLLLNQDSIITNETIITQNAGGANTQVQQQIIQSARQQPGFAFGDPAQGLGNSGSARSLASAAAVGAQGLSSFAVNRVSPDLGFGGMVLSASSESVSMLLRALQESRRLEVLSRPQIMALDNQPGRAFVGELVPIITFSETNQFGNPQNSIVQQPVGLELIVQPRISPDDLVVMVVSAYKRELGPLDQGVPIAIAPNGDPIRVPRINSTEAETTVSAVSGQTVVLSGLLTKRDEALHRRVPLLADIPLVGDLFRYDSTRNVRTELLIVLTPRVIRSRYQSEVVKQTESARMSWCLSDVVDLHGAAGLRSRNDMMGAAEAPALYPTETLDDNGQVVSPDAELLPMVPPPTPAEAAGQVPSPYLAPPAGPPPVPPQVAP